MILLLRELALLAGTGISAYTDWKNGLIYDKVSYPMIALGIILNLIEFQWNAFWMAGLLLVIGYLLYFAGKIGGGDVKLFVGMVLLLPYLNGQIFILGALFAAAVIAVIVLASYYVGKYVLKGIDLQENKECLLKAVLLGLIMGAYFYFIYSNKLISLNYILLLGTPLFFALGFLAFERGIRKEFFLKKVKVKDLGEDELAAIDFLDEETKKKLGFTFKGIIGEKDKQRLKELGVKEILIYNNVPGFAPFVFLGTIIVLINPELIKGILF